MRKKSELMRPFKTPAKSALAGVLQRKGESNERNAEVAQSPEGWPPIVKEVLQLPGRPLETETQTTMEAKFHRDFSHVKVHSDEKAEDAAAAVAARAFTVNNQIVFGRAEYAPESPAGRKLLSHELTHVLQQGSGLARQSKASEENSQFEKRAEEVANRLTAGSSPGPIHTGVPQSDSTSGATGMLQKQEDPKKKKTDVNKAQVTSLNIEPITFSLDENPARGATERAEMLAKQGPAQKKTYSPSDPSSIWDAALDWLDQLDRALVLDAKQGGYALSFSGSNTSSEGSTAAKPAKDVVFLNSTNFDVTEVIEMMNVVLLSVSRKEEMFTTPEDLKENPFEVIYDVREKLKEIEEAQEEERKKAEAAEESDELKAKKQTLEVLEILKKVRELKQKMQRIDFKKLKKQKSSPSVGVSEPGTTTSAESTKKFDSRGQTQQWLSGELSDSEGRPDPEGAISIYTDKKGKRRLVKEWIDKRGYVQYKVLKVLEEGEEAGHQSGAPPLKTVPLKTFKD